jgi:tetratricopeptide (TPR) repeat protein
MNQEKRDFQEEMEHDAFVEGMLNAWEVVVQNKVRVILAVVVLVAAVLGILAVKRSAELEEAAASVLVNRAVTLYDLGEFAKASELFEQAEDQFPGSMASHDALYFLGFCALHEGHLDEARQALSVYLSTHTSNAFLTAGAHGGLASCFERENKWLEASEEWTQAAFVGEGNFFADRNLLNAALCCELAGEKDEAAQLLDRLLETYPASKFKSRVELIQKRVKTMN